MVKTACDLFEIPHLDHARDLWGVCGLLHLAHLAEPRDDTPERLPEVVVSDVAASAIAHPEVGMIEMTLKSAAVRHIAADPARKDEILSRLAAKQTPAQAAAFLREAESNIKTWHPRRTDSARRGAAPAHSGARRQRRTLPDSGADRADRVDIASAHDQPIPQAPDRKPPTTRSAMPRQPPVCDRPRSPNGTSFLSCCRADASVPGRDRQGLAQRR